MRIAATSDRHRLPGASSARCRTLFVLSGDRVLLTPPAAARHRPAPRRSGLGATARSAACAPVPRSSSSCARRSAPRSACDTSAPAHCPFWNIRKRHANWISPCRTRAIASFGQALLLAFQTAFVGRSREPGVARHRSSISKRPRQDLPHQHVRRLDADTDHPGEQPHHRMRPCIRCPLEPLGTGLLDRADPLTDECQPRHVAPKLLDDVRRQARALRCPQTCQTLWRLAQMWFESSDPETGERTLHAVGDA